MGLKGFGWGVGFRVSGFRVSEFRVSGFRHRVVALANQGRVGGFGFRVKALLVEQLSVLAQACYCSRLGDTPVHYLFSKLGFGLGLNLTVNKSL